MALEQNKNILSNTRLTEPTFRPVLDPKASWGVGIFTVESEAKMADRGERPGRPQRARLLL
jgi:hypothetical protein